jgi:hypothetical protein
LIEAARQNATEISIGVATKSPEAYRMRDRERDVVVKKINRLLKARGERLVVARGAATKKEFGLYHKITDAGIITERHLDVIQVAVELGVVKPAALAAAA